MKWRPDDERELVDALGRHLVELEVLEKVDAVDDERNLMRRQRKLPIRSGSLMGCGQRQGIWTESKM